MITELNSFSVKGEGGKNEGEITKRECVSQQFPNLKLKLTYLDNGFRLEFYKTDESGDPVSNTKFRFHKDLFGDDGKKIAEHTFDQIKNILLTSDTTSDDVFEKIVQYF